MGTLNADTIKSMMESSNCTLADLAATFEVTLDDVVSFLRLHQMELPSAKNSAGASAIAKLLSAALPEKTITGNKPSLMLDYMNGLPQGLSMAALQDPTNILAKFHAVDLEKGLQCPYCGRYETDIVGDPDNDFLSMFADNNPSNFLLTNIDPCCKQCMLERFDQMPIMSEEIDYPLSITDEDVPEEIHRLTSMKIIVTRRVDALLGGVCNKFFLDQLFEQWIVCPLKTGKAFFDGVPYTPAMVSVWAFRQLSEFGLLKGLTNVETTTKAPDGSVVTAAVSFETFLVHYSMLYKSMEQQMKAQAKSNLVAPGTPENLDRAKNLSKLTTK
jgi:hypothetical protein